LFLLCGLGNKGPEYARTRHNIGYLVVERYSEKYDIPIAKTRYGCKMGISENVVLAKPHTYMNLSGAPVSQLVKSMNIPLDHLVLIHDDLDMDFGRIKIRWNGTSGGHRGVESVINALQSGLFHRVKIGIGRDQVMPPDEYVLSRFRKADSETLEEALDGAVDALHVLINEGKAKAMSMFNKSPAL